MHVERGAKLVDFAGWEMPIMYKSIIEEHKQVRAAGGMFDVSHMGRLKLSGRDAQKLIDKVATRRISDQKEETCRYSLVCNEQGGVLDDIIIYRYDDHWMLVVNASNREKILKHLQAHAADLKVKIDDLTLSTSMLALQGPKVMENIAKFSGEVPALKRYSFCVKSFLFVKVTISRTGYTGEDGVEVILPAKMPQSLLNMVLHSGGVAAEQVMQPAGLGARDSLRLEAGMPLYGHELDENTDPLSAGLNFAVALDKGENSAFPGESGFIGQAALKRIAADGPKRKLVGLKLEGKRTARQGMPVTKDGGAAGVVTSGCLSPTLGYPIAMAYVDAAQSAVGNALQVDLGGKPTDAQVVPLPFFKRPK